MIDRLTPRKSMVGTLYLSSTHTIFVENSEARKETWVGIETLSCRQSSFFNFFFAKSKLNTEHRFVLCSVYHSHYSHFVMIQAIKQLHFC